MNMLLKTQWLAKFSIQHLKLSYKPTNKKKMTTTINQRRRKIKQRRTTLQCGISNIEKWLKCVCFGHRSDRICRGSRTPIRLKTTDLYYTVAPLSWWFMNLHVVHKCLKGILSFIPADKEYLHKDQDGNVFLYNAETSEESLYLSNSTFVIYLYCHILLQQTQCFE